MQVTLSCGIDDLCISWGSFLCGPGDWLGLGFGLALKSFSKALFHNNMHLSLSIVRVIRPYRVAFERN